MADAYSDFIESRGAVSGIVDSVHGAEADVSMAYAIPTSQNGQLRWSIDGTLRFVHGKQGWVVDRDFWENRKLNSVVLPNGTVEPVSQSAITGGETIRFVIADQPYEWTRLPKLSWSIASLAPNNVPTELPVANSSHRADEAPPIANATNEVPPEAAAVAPGEEAAPAYTSSLGAVTDAGCEQIDVSGVYGDGEIIETDDGTRYHVDDGDTATSTVWVAPFEGLICDAGAKLINKDDNESVDLQP